MNKKQGFTFIEIMISVVIIGTLIAIAVPTYRSSLERAKCSQALHTLREIRNAALDYYRENEDFGFANIADLEDQVGANFQSLINSNQPVTPDWLFDIAVNNFLFTVTATRQGGEHIGEAITLNQDENWSNPAAVGNYPWDNP